MIKGLLESIASLQNKNEEDILFGNYKSYRYHKLLPIKREEDNVYFVAWINQLLMRNFDSIPQGIQELARDIISKGETAISQYRNRYGEKTYNFYRPQAWFPSSNLLSRWVLFQPTDDSDDSSIALRGKRHTKTYAEEIKDIYRHQSNGLRGRFIRRVPKEYRAKRFYNTWIGSEGLYVDLDLVVLCNILMFNSQYDLDTVEEDIASIELLMTAVYNGDYLNKEWSLCAWYPFKYTILYSIADLISSGYYTDLDELRATILKDIENALASEKNLIGKLLLENALMKLGGEIEATFPFPDVDDVLRSSRTFSFGVIPLLHPFNGLAFQYLARFDLFRMYYRCDAQCLAIMLENHILRNPIASHLSSQEILATEDVS